MGHYFDYAATTPVCREAVEAAVDAMTGGWGNPSARYPFGTDAGTATERWRNEIAKALHCQKDEVFFTSCGTEGDNWAIYGAVELNRRVGKHIITTAIEHSAVLEPCKELERRGYEVTYLKPDRQGRISVQQVEEALREDTVLVSMMLVNNELGTILPIAEVGRCLKEYNSRALFHCDGVQGFLKVPCYPKELGVDLLSISGHKVHAPKGIGALYIRKGVKLPPMIRGGGQEHGLRSGTEATAQIAAFGAAVQVGCQQMEQIVAHMREQKELLWTLLQEKLPNVKRVGEGTAPHILTITMPGYKSEVVVRVLGDMGICVSSGSACHKGKASHVYAALGLPKKELDGVFRISFSKETTREDVEALAEGLVQVSKQLFISLS